MNKDFDDDDDFGWDSEDDKKKSLSKSPVKMATQKDSGSTATLNAKLGEKAGKVLENVKSKVTASLNYGESDEEPVDEYENDFEEEVTTYKKKSPERVKEVHSTLQTSPTLKNKKKVEEDNYDEEFEDEEDQDDYKHEPKQTVKHKSPKVNGASKSLASEAELQLKVKEQLMHNKGAKLSVLDSVDQVVNETKAKIQKIEANEAQYDMLPTEERRKVFLVNQNKLLRDELKKINDNLTILLQKEDPTSLAGKSYARKKQDSRPNSKKLKAREKEMTNVDKLMNNLAMEHGKIRTRLEKIKDPYYMSELTQKLQQVNERINKLKMMKKKLSINQYQREKEMDKIIDEGEPDSMKKITAMTNQLTVLNQKLSELKRKEAQQKDVRREQNDQEQKVRDKLSQTEQTAEEYQVEFPDEKTTEKDKKALDEKRKLEAQRDMLYDAKNKNDKRMRQQLQAVSKKIDEFSAKKAAVELSLKTKNQELYLKNEHIMELLSISKISSELSKGADGLSNKTSNTSHSNRRRSSSPKFTKEKNVQRDVPNRKSQKLPPPPRQQDVQKAIDKRIKLESASALVIQSAARGYLARRQIKQQIKAGKLVSKAKTNPDLYPVTRKGPKKIKGEKKNQSPQHEKKPAEFTIMKKETFEKQKTVVEKPIEAPQLEKKIHEEDTGPFMSAKKLNELIASANPNLKIYECSNSLNASDNFKKECIPGAQLIEMKQMQEMFGSKYQMTFPSQQTFTTLVETKNAKKTDIIVLYEQSFGCLAMRAWYVFRSFGHKNVFVLDGSLNTWKAEGFETTKKNSHQRIIPSGDFAYQFDMNAVIGFEDLLKGIKESRGSIQVIDARTHEEYEGKSLGGDSKKDVNSVEIKKGHIAGAINIPFNTFFDQEGKLLASKRADAKNIFSQKGVVLGKHLVVYCNVGALSCAVIAALEYAGYDLRNVRLYDNSWQEWGTRAESKDFIEPAAVTEQYKRMETSNINSGINGKPGFEFNVQANFGMGHGNAQSQVTPFEMKASAVNQSKPGGEAGFQLGAQLGNNGGAQTGLNLGMKANVKEQPAMFNPMANAIKKGKANLLEALDSLDF